MILNTNHSLLTTRQSMVILIVNIFISGIFLSGCVGMGNNFDCNVDSGGRCAPMHQINHMANHGSFSATGIFANRPYAPDKSKSAERKDSNTQANIDGAMPPRSNLLRSNEKVQQIWIGPYEDVNGNYHEGSNVYTVMKKSEWLPEH